MLSVFISLLFLSVATGTQFVHLGNANPLHKYHSYKEWAITSPDWSTKPPVVSIGSPDNNAMCGVDALVLTFNASIGPSETASYCRLDEIYYETDWQSNKTYLYKSSHNKLSYYNPSRYTEYSETINVTGIPDGNHTIKVTAVESGLYETFVDYVDLWDVIHYYTSFTITGSSLLRFSVDTTPPVVSVFSPANKTYYSPETPLNFTVNEKSSMFYSLDGSDNVIVAGNTTLKDLPVGVHNVTVYATDVAGNTGESETIRFSIDEPFPTTMVVAPIASAAFVGAGLLVYFEKRKH
jgi:hypothetical protein